MSGDNIINLEIKSDSNSNVYCQVSSITKLNESNPVKSKSVKLKEFEEGYRVFQDLMVANLKYLEGKWETVNQEIQVYDEEGILQTAKLKLEIKNKEATVELMKQKANEQKCNYEKIIESNSKDYESREKIFKNEISKLNDKWNKLYKELIQVKHILRTPYLYK